MVILIINFTFSGLVLINRRGAEEQIKSELIFQALKSANYLNTGFGEKPKSLRRSRRKEHDKC